MAKLTTSDTGLLIDDNGMQTSVQYTDKNLGSNFQYLQNPTTKKIVGVGKDLFSKYGQDFASQGFNPVNADVFNQPSNLNLQNITGSTNSISQGTGETIRGDASALDVLGEQTQNFLNETVSSPDLSAALASLSAQRDTLKTLSQQDLAAIDQAGTEAGLAFDPLITEAEKAKRFGLPKALVGAGERGGLMNTQFAGAAALTPTEGGTFFGAGGELERIKSVYDDNISKIKANKEQAIAQAKIAARQAIISGKKDDFNIAVQLYNLARQSHQDALDLQAKKINALTAYQQERRAEQGAQLDLDKFDFEKQKYLYGLSNPKVETSFQDSIGTDGLTHRYLVNSQTGDIIKDLGATKNIVKEMGDKYSDAGILPTDSLDVATAKMKTSKIYKQQTRLSGGGGGGGGASKSENDAVSLYSGAIGQAILSGVKDADTIVAGIQFQANESGVNLSVAQLNAIRQKAETMLAGYTPPVEKSEQQEQAEAINAMPEGIEKEIASIKRSSPNFSDGDIRAVLLAGGKYSEDEIGDSSVAGFIDKTINSIENFIFGK